jgi:hypothetical protein
MMAAESSALPILRQQHLRSCSRLANTSTESTSRLSAHLSTGVTEFGVRYQDPAFGQTGALTYIYMLADGDSMAIVTTERRLKTNADPAWTGPDHKWEYPIFVRLFTDWNKKWPERRAFGQREMEEIEYPERMMHGGIGRGHRGARTKAREWVRDQMLQKVSSNG